MRKALDMDAEVGAGLEGVRQEESCQLFQRKLPVARREVIQKVMAASVNATKVRESGQEQITDSGERKCPTLWRDAKIGAISEIEWDEKRHEAVCRSSSYVCGIEHAGEFFKRLAVEMHGRAEDLNSIHAAFLADGANWIWDRFLQMAPQHSTFIFDFFHACEHVSDLCTYLYAEQTPQYWQHFRAWKQLLFDGRIQEFLLELHHLRDAAENAQHRDFIQGAIKYFQDNQDRIHYERYRAMKLPICSGTIESACKNVIGGRMNQGGMTWSEAGAQAMLQIRTSIESSRFLDDFLATLDRAA